MWIGPGSTVLTKRTPSLWSGPSRTWFPSRGLAPGGPKHRLALRPDDPDHLRGRPRRHPLGLRRVHYVDPESGQRLILLTHHFGLPALVIAEIYRRRWSIELFFRRLKQHLRLRGFFSPCPNGVAVQIWTALCACLLVAIAKQELGLPGSLHQILQVISVCAFEKGPLRELLAESDGMDSGIASCNQLLFPCF